MTIPIKVAVIGGGIAGVTTAAFIAKQHAEVTLYETSSHLCSGASGNPAGSIQPFFGSPKDELTQYYQRAYHYAQSYYDNMPEDVVSGAGSLDIRPILSEKPEKFAHIADADRWLTSTVYKEYPYIFTEKGGVYVASAKTISPIGVANIICKQQSFRTCYHSTLISCTETEECCTLYFDNGRREQVDIVVLCNGFSANRLINDVPLLSVKGQISTLKRSYSHLKRMSIHGGGYAITVPGTDTLLIGATFEKHYTDRYPTTKADEENMTRVGAFLPEILHDDIASHRTSFRTVLPDRRAVIGRSPGYSRVFLNTGHGSRGLMSAPYAAFLLTRMMAESFALGLSFHVDATEKDIRRIVSPSRFLERMQRKLRHV